MSIDDRRVQARSESYNICACGFQSLSKMMTVSASWKKKEPKGSWRYLSIWACRRWTPLWQLDCQFRVNCCQLLSNVVNLDLQKTHLLAFQSEAALERLLLRIFWKADSCRPSRAEFQQPPKLIIFWPFKKDQKEPLRQTSHPSPVESAVLGS